MHVPSDFIAGVRPEHWRGSLLGDKAHSVVFDNSKIKRFVPDFAATIPFTWARGEHRVVRRDPARLPRRAWKSTDEWTQRSSPGGA